MISTIMALKSGYDMGAGVVTVARSINSVNSAYKSVSGFLGFGQKKVLKSADEKDKEDLNKEAKRIEAAKQLSEAEKLSQSVDTYMQSVDISKSINAQINKDLFDKVNAEEQSKFIGEGTLENNTFQIINQSSRNNVYKNKLKDKKKQYKALAYKIQKDTTVPGEEIDKEKAKKIDDSRIDGQTIIEVEKLKDYTKYQREFFYNHAALAVGAEKYIKSGHTGSKYSGFKRWFALFSRGRERATGDIKQIGSDVANATFSKAYKSNFFFNACNAVKNFTKNGFNKFISFFSKKEKDELQLKLEEISNQFDNQEHEKLNFESAKEYSKKYHEYLDLLNGRLDELIEQKNTAEFNQRTMLDASKYAKEYTEVSDKISKVKQTMIQLESSIGNLDSLIYEANVAYRRHKEIYEGLLPFMREKSKGKNAERMNKYLKVGGENKRKDLMHELALELLNSPIRKSAFADGNVIKDPVALYSYRDKLHGFKVLYEADPEFHNSLDEGTQRLIAQEILGKIDAYDELVQQHMYYHGIKRKTEKGVTVKKFGKDGKPKIFTAGDEVNIKDSLSTDEFDYDVTGSQVNEFKTAKGIYLGRNKDANYADNMAKLFTKTKGNLREIQRNKDFIFWNASSTIDSYKRESGANKDYFLEYAGAEEAYLLNYVLVDKNDKKKKTFKNEKYVFGNIYDPVKQTELYNKRQEILESQIKGADTIDKLLQLGEDYQYDLDEEQAQVINKKLLSKSTFNFKDAKSENAGELKKSKSMKFLEQGLEWLNSSASQNHNLVSVTTPERTVLKNTLFDLIDSKEKAYVKLMNIKSAILSSGATIQRKILDRDAVEMAEKAHNEIKLLDQSITAYMAAAKFVSNDFSFNGIGAQEGLEDGKFEQDCAPLVKSVLNAHGMGYLYELPAIISSYRDQADAWKEYVNDYVKKSNIRDDLKIVDFDFNNKENLEMLLKNCRRNYAVSKAIDDIEEHSDMKKAFDNIKEMKENQPDQIMKASLDMLEKIKQGTDPDDALEFTKFNVSQTTDFTQEITMRRYMLVKTFAALSDILEKNKDNEEFNKRYELKGDKLYDYRAMALIFKKYEVRWDGAYKIAKNKYLINDDIRGSIGVAHIDRFRNKLKDKEQQQVESAHDEKTKAANREKLRQLSEAYEGHDMMLDGVDFKSYITINKDTFDYVKARLKKKVDLEKLQKSDNAVADLVFMDLQRSYEYESMRLFDSLDDRAVIKTKNEERIPFSTRLSEKFAAINATTAKNDQVSPMACLLFLRDNDHLRDVDARYEKMKPRIGSGKDPDGLVEKTKKERDKAYNIQKLNMDDVSDYVFSEYHTDSFYLLKQDQKKFNSKLHNLCQSAIIEAGSIHISLDTIYSESALVYNFQENLRKAMKLQGLKEFMKLPNTKAILKEDEKLKETANAIANDETNQLFIDTVMNFAASRGFDVSKLNSMDNQLDSRVKLENIRNNKDEFIQAELKRIESNPQDRDVIMDNIRKKLFETEIGKFQTSHKKLLEKIHDRDSKADVNDVISYKQNIDKFKYNIFKTVRKVMFDPAKGQEPYASKQDALAAIADGKLLVVEAAVGDKTADKDAVEKENLIYQAEAQRLLRTYSADPAEINREFNNFDNTLLAEENMLKSKFQLHGIDNKQLVNEYVNLNTELSTLYNKYVENASAKDKQIITDYLNLKSSKGVQLKDIDILMTLTPISRLADGSPATEKDIEDDLKNRAIIKLITKSESTLTSNLFKEEDNANSSEYQKTYIKSLVDDIINEIDIPFSKLDTGYLIKNFTVLYRYSRKLKVLQHLYNEDLAEQAKNSTDKNRKLTAFEQLKTQYSEAEWQKLMLRVSGDRMNEDGKNMIAGSGYVSFVDLMDFLLESRCLNESGGFNEDYLGLDDVQMARYVELNKQKTDTVRTRDREYDRLIEEEVKLPGEIKELEKKLKENTELNDEEKKAINDEITAKKNRQKTIAEIKKDFAKNTAEAIRKIDADRNKILEAANKQVPQKLANSQANYISALYRARFGNDASSIGRTLIEGNKELNIQSKGYDQTERLYQKGLASVHALIKDKVDLQYFGMFLGSDKLMNANLIEDFAGTYSENTYAEHLQSINGQTEEETKKLRAEEENKIRAVNKISALIEMTKNANVNHVPITKNTVTVDYLRGKFIDKNGNGEMNSEGAALLVDIKKNIILSQLYQSIRDEIVDTSADGEMKFKIEDRFVTNDKAEVKEGYLSKAEVEALYTLEQQYGSKVYADELIQYDQQVTRLAETYRIDKNGSYQGEDPQNSTAKAKGRLLRHNYSKLYETSLLMQGRLDETSFGSNNQVLDANNAHVNKTRLRGRRWFEEEIFQEQERIRLAEEAHLKKIKEAEERQKMDEAEKARIQKEQIEDITNYLNIMKDADWKDPTVLKDELFDKQFRETIEESRKLQSTKDILDETSSAYLKSKVGLGDDVVGYLTSTLTKDFHMSKEEVMRFVGDLQISQMVRDDLTARIKTDIANGKVDDKNDPLEAQLAYYKKKYKCNTSRAYSLSIMAEYRTRIMSVLFKILDNNVADLAPESLVKGEKHPATWRSRGWLYRNTSKTFDLDSFSLKEGKVNIVHEIKANYVVNKIMKFINFDDNWLSDLKKFNIKTATKADKSKEKNELESMADIVKNKDDFDHMSAKFQSFYNEYKNIKLSGKEKDLKFDQCYDMLEFIFDSVGYSVRHLELEKGNRSKTDMVGKFMNAYQYGKTTVIPDEDRLKFRAEYQDRHEKRQKNKKA
ncbi:MAG: hypothetical protein K6F99_07085 [Lachnospiraceae bacterium]|nr:hypothetical protein [Lachnospiraceae bacterium]